MEAGQRYYAITIKKTGDYLRDNDYNALRFKTEKDALKYLEDDGEDLTKYEITCLRW